MIRTLIILAALASLPAIAQAQSSPLDDLFKSPDVDVGGGLLSAPEPQVTAALNRAGETVTLSIRVDLPEGGYTYSQNAEAVQPASPTVFEVASVPGLTPVDAAFTPTHPPKLSFDENFNKELEKHFGTVTWTRKYRLDPGADAANLSLAGSVKLLYCKTSCKKLTLPFRAALAAAAASAAPTGVTELAPPDSLFGDDASDLPPPVEDLSAPGEATAAADATVGGTTAAYTVIPQYGGKNHVKGDPAKVSFVLDTSVGDDLAILAVRLELAEGFHVRALTAAPGQPPALAPTQLELKQVQGLSPVVGEFSPTAAPVLHEESEAGQVIRTLDHDGSITWTQVFRLDPTSRSGVSGVLTYQICRGASFCLRPKTIEFSLGSLQAEADIADAAPTSESLPDSERQAALAAASLAPAGAGGSLANIAYEDDAQANSLPTWLLFAFLGGLILNVMPCVLPVISIKALSFVHQAGENPGRILLLNVVYSLGVLSVFFALATLAITLKLGWGAQNQSAAYNIVMVAVVFAMGLSLLGVFEIPIPGMMSSGIGGQQHGEGLVGAFLTGILATMLATPCTGPYMATTLFWSLQQPTYVVFLIFGTMGLGMASPYLMIGCVPAMIDWLPRPGNWMVTFKQVCGFLLMGTSVWMLNTIHAINTELVIPTLIILVGVAVMVWMIGQLYNLSSTQTRRWAIRGLACLVAGPIIALGVNWSRQATIAAHGGYELPWQDFSEQKLEELVRDGKPVLVDFTAEWCGICKANEFRALNTETTLTYVQQHGFVPLKADYTKERPEIREWLTKFGQDSVPLYLFIPGGQPSKTLVLRETINQDDVLEKLQQAVANSAAAPVGAATTASRTDKAVSLTR